MGSEPISIPQPIPGSTDYDAPYTWGRPPSTYLAFRQIVRLTILRSRLRESASELDSPPLPTNHRAGARVSVGRAVPAKRRNPSTPLKHPTLASGSA